MLLIYQITDILLTWLFEGTSNFSLGSWSLRCCVLGFFLTALTSHTDKAAIKTDGLKMICTSQSGGLGKQLLTMSAVFFPQNLPKISCRIVQRVPGYGPEHTKLGHHLLQHCYLDGPLPLAFVGCRALIYSYWQPFSQLSMLNQQWRQSLKESSPIGCSCTDSPDWRRQLVWKRKASLFSFLTAGTSCFAFLDYKHLNRLLPPQETTF